MFSKKAVSPLIATVLLVMIVVSIGAAVMVVIQGLSEEQIQNIEAQKDLLACGNEVRIDIFKVGSKSKICVNNIDSPLGIEAILIMENKGLRDIAGFRVTAFGNNGFNISTFDNTSLPKSGETMKAIRFIVRGNISSSENNIEKISINPRIAGKDIITCSDPSLEFDSDYLRGVDDCDDVSWDNNVITAT